MLAASLIRELEQESATTRRVLERIPNDRLAWKPHPKSMTIGHLAMHIAVTPAFITGWALQDSVEAVGGAPEMQPGSTAEILAAHDDSIGKARAALTSLGDAGLQRDWSMTAQGATLFTWSKTELVRAYAMNHLYHHRGQLSVYLRQLDVPVPSIYGPSADESPMG
jgi:uncharacterized damage-inducible protein DinB